MSYSRRKSRQLQIGDVTIGGDAPVSVQSMTNTDTRDAVATLSQIRELAAAGCQIIRCAVPDHAAAEAMADIVAGSPIPVIADIHFDYRLALASVKAGVHGIRINPGNIGSEDKVRMVAEACGLAGVPIRVGVNSGSLPKDLQQLVMGGELSLPEALVQGALLQCAMLEKYSFNELKVSLKSSDVTTTVAACELFAGQSDYPLHLGITEAGTLKRGIIKSAAGIGALLLRGIGDTIRVSLTADPVEEVRTAITLLEAVGLRDAAPEIVSCPTCGRTEVQLIQMAEKVEELVASIKAEGKHIKLKKIAVMGCVVNGPGEASDADIGLAGGKNNVMLFKHGEKIGVYSESEAFALLREFILEHAE
jgi:(E)-4-hydroxy-3-methylbut-2-enyl-diphosphate synthase